MRVIVYDETKGHAAPTYMVQTTSQKTKARYNQQPSALKRKIMQLQTSRLPAQKYNSSNVPNVLSLHLWIGAVLLVWPDLSTPANELRIAVQAIGDEIHDVFLGSMFIKDCIVSHPSNKRAYLSLMCCNLVHSKTKCLSSPKRAAADTWCRCADCVARVGSCVGLSQTAKCGNLGKSAAAAGLCEDWQGAHWERTL